MPQPDYVPLQNSDQVRADDCLPAPTDWRPNRPGDIHTVHQPRGSQFGVAGPDQGYGLKLARHFKDRLILTEHENVEDAVEGCLVVGLKRAALFGRAPVVYDFELAYTLWGFLGNPPADLVQHRIALFEAASHHYEDQREIADAVPDSTLRLSPKQVADRISDWHSLIIVPSS